MKFFADESLESEITAFLRNKGHTVFSIIEILPSLSDEEVLDFAAKNDAVLLTNDKDFGDLVIRQNLNHKGIVLLRLRKMNPSKKSAILSEVIETHGGELSGRFTVVSRTSVRIRKDS